MRQDTHWTPEWMEKVAGDLAAFLVGKGLVPLTAAAGARTWRAVAKSVSRVGDVTDMLGLPEGQTLFSPETHTIHEVQDAKGAPVRAERARRRPLAGRQLHERVQRGTDGVGRQPPGSARSWRARWAATWT